MSINLKGRMLLEVAWKENYVSNLWFKREEEEGNIQTARK